MFTLDVTALGKKSVPGQETTVTRAELRGLRFENIKDSDDEEGGVDGEDEEDEDEST